MTLTAFLNRIQNGEAVNFDDTMAVISENYHYHPTEFRNGQGDDSIVNPAGSNEGSCKIFAFAGLHQLSPDQTLSLFGDFYHRDVLQDPGGAGHQNIRLFMKYGWKGIEFRDTALTPKV